MFILVAFAFIGGVVTILSPCILPILPIVLSGSVGEGKKKPFGIVTGFVFSFTFFTLFLTGIVQATGVSPDVLRNVAVVILAVFGLTLLFPQVQGWIEKLFSKLASRAPQSQQRHGFFGGFLVGLTLGLIWTPCVGPILASVISLALTGSVNGSAFIITLAYALGTVIPMFAVIYGGRQLLNKVPWLLRNGAKIQKVFGILMIITALMIFFNYDRKFQTYILEKFPNYGTSLTGLEDNNLIKEQLNLLDDDKKSDSKNISTSLKNLLNNMQTYQAPELIPGGEWLNSKPLTLKELRGQVVLIDFMTYSCINCIRTFPALNDLYEKYKDEGLVIIGIHTPEFEFEKNPVNVKAALEDYNIRFPVMQDNNFATWRAYENRYWPHKFLIDHEGKVVYDHIGEGAYEETEEVIREFLAKRNEALGMEFTETKLDEFNIETTQARSPETYFGAWRNSNFGSGNPLQVGDFNFTTPGKIETDVLYLVGDWKLTKEYAENTSSNAEIIFSYNASKVFIVSGADQEVEIDVYTTDTDGSNKSAIKTMKIQEEKLYRLVEGEKREKRIIHIVIKQPGLMNFAFTFG